MIKMNKKGIKNTARRGAVTIEFAFGIIAAAVVLMLILGIFNDNVKEMVDASRFQNLFAENDGGSTALDDQTKYKSLEHDPTQNIIGTAGTQGLAYWNKKALDEIKAILADGVVTAAERIALAKALTMYGATAALGQTGSTALSNTSLTSLGIKNGSEGAQYSNLYELAYRNNININWQQHYTDITGVYPRYEWTSSVVNSTTPIDSSNSVSLSSVNGQENAVKAINSNTRW